MPDACLEKQLENPDASFGLQWRRSPETSSRWRGPFPSAPILRRVSLGSEASFRGGQIVDEEGKKRLKGDDLQPRNAIEVARIVGADRVAEFDRTRADDEIGKR